MAYCPNCGTEYAQQPARCQCGYLFGGSSPGKFEFKGEGARLLVLYIKLIVFSVFTLGIYSFWGRAEIRKYLWSNTYFAGQPFDYHGTGKELFFGWLKLIGLLIVLYCFVTLYIVMKLGPPELALMIFYLPLAVLAPLAIHGAVRYRWSRTSWNGRRFVYNGQLQELAIIVVPGMLLSLVTLSLYVPFFLVNLRRYITNNTAYAGQSLYYEGDGRDLLWDYVKFLLLFLPTLGIYRFWCQARMYNYNWNRTRFATVPFPATVAEGQFRLSSLTNCFFRSLTLGL